MRRFVVIAVAIVAVFSSLSIGCFFRDIKPPMIRSYSIDSFSAVAENKWGMENEPVVVRVEAYDDQGVRDAYSLFNDEIIIPLNKVTSTVSKENEGTVGENATWEGKDKLIAGLYNYTIVVKDQYNQTSEKGAIKIFPYDSDGDGINYRDELKYGLDPNKPDPVAKYLLDRDLGFLIPKLKLFNENTAFDDKAKAAVDLIAAYYPKIRSILPDIGDDIIDLFDIKSIDVTYIENMQALFELASDPAYKLPFEMMFKNAQGNRTEICEQIKQYAPLIENEDALDEVASNSPYAGFIKNLLKQNAVKNVLHTDSTSKIIHILLKLYPKYCNAER